MPVPVQAPKHENARARAHTHTVSPSLPLFLFHPHPSFNIQTHLSPNAHAHSYTQDLSLHPLGIHLLPLILSLIFRRCICALQKNTDREYEECTRHSLYLSSWQWRVSSHATCCKLFSAITSYVFSPVRQMMFLRNGLCKLTSFIKCSDL